MNEVEKVHYTKVDCDLMIKKLGQFTHQADNIKLKLQDNEFLIKLISELNEF